MSRNILRPEVSEVTRLAVWAHSYHKPATIHTLLPFWVYISICFFVSFLKQQGIEDLLMISRVRLSVPAKYAHKVSEIYKAQ